ncbi:putative signal-transduction protein containing cAMP-binding and CBS domains [Candidatus Nitrososphaera evergladensis SR1]|uniref:Putative signal-transduction protein containing cAMP-binding and CBS domains n=1 Tax=Candidatus Nitrososphaera evergladensis SR1 TaxID=1459636 RepID=A0A075MN66_9ARCH|nr:CBS domain-containing protein [Candidatus Nitrososphaera evergladensis]AIF82976.1 putative signal-transduction protein containing cAMP-binding and CBS domains [Candidatus Nitrososphaera evergladensis SR1]
MSAVSEIMSSKIVTVDADSDPSVLDVVEAMVKHKEGAIIILEKRRPVGIITERDVLKKVSAQNKKPKEISAKSIMSSPLITVKAYDSVDTAAQAMTKNKIKRLPVVETGGSLVGMMSATDITRRLAKILADDYSRYRSLGDALEL